jgi:argininosuccinate synthase
MNPVIVLADDGDFDGAVITALGRQASADVVTVTVDIGQSRDVHAVRAIALAAGAVRAHVVDAVDDFVRDCVLPSLQSPPAAPRHAGGSPHSSATLAYPIIAAWLVEVARREQTRLVAHGGGTELTAAIHRLDPALQVLTVETVRRSAAPPFLSARHLLQRPVADPAAARGIAANVEIEFDGAVPISINGVALTPAELIESLSLIGGQHGIGHAESVDAPGALVLAAAYRALDRESGIVRIELLDGQQRILSADSHSPVLVNHA